MSTNKHFVRKVRIAGNLAFSTAFHIGSGREGEMASDMGVLLDPDGDPVLPGSSLKGNFRTFAERLAPYLNMTACLLDSDLSGVDCVGDEAYRRGKVHEAFIDLKSEKQKLSWLAQHTCDVCRLFGSPYQASKIFFSDGVLEEWSRSIQVRDGVCIDRDTETARHGAKYDFEVAPKDAIFSTVIEIENPDDQEIALVAAVIGEWENGFRLGGFTSRGLGRVRFIDTKVMELDYTDKNALLAYLMEKKMPNAPDLLTTALAVTLSSQGEEHA